MSNRARLSQTRSRHRREQLLDAVIELFAEDGPRGITHRAVAARAGLAPATTTYYFRSIDELIEEALSRHIEEWSRNLEKLTHRPPATGTADDEINRLIAELVSSHSTDTIALYVSIYLASARTPQLSERAADSRRALEAVARTILHDTGIDRADDLAVSIVLAIAGSALYRLSSDRTDEEETALLYRTVRGLVVTGLMTEDEIDERLDSLSDSGRTTS